MSDPQDINYACDLINAEALRAIELFPPMHNGHEGKAVIEEELDELWEEVKRYPNEDHSALMKEAIQIGAMAARFIADVCLADNLNLITFLRKHHSQEEILAALEQEATPDTPAADTPEAP